MCCRLVLRCSHLYCFSFVGLKIQFSPCFLHLSDALSFHSVIKWSGPAIPSKTLIVLLQERHLPKGRMCTADSRYFFLHYMACVYSLPSFFLDSKCFPNALKENSFILSKTGSCFVIFLEICVPCCVLKSSAVPIMYLYFRVWYIVNMFHTPFPECFPSVVDDFVCV